jgi:hypothetical protein
VHPRPLEQLEIRLDASLPVVPQRHFAGRHRRRDEKVREPNEAAREAMGRIAERAIRRKKPAFLFVNNRLEGHAPTTIEAVADQLV